MRISGRCRASSFGMSCGMKRTTAEIEPRCRNAERRKLPMPCTGRPMFSSRESSSSRKWASVRRSASRETIAWGASRSWLIGTQTPLILIVIGDPTERKRSDACFSAIRPNRRSSDVGVVDMTLDLGLLRGKAYDCRRAVANPSDWMKRGRMKPLASAQVVAEGAAARPLGQLLATEPGVARRRAGHTVAVPMPLNAAQFCLRRRRGRQKEQPVLCSSVSPVPR